MARAFSGGKSFISIKVQPCGEATAAFLLLLVSLVLLWALCQIMTHTPAIEAQSLMLVTLLLPQAQVGSPQLRCFFLVDRWCWSWTGLLRLRQSMENRRRRSMWVPPVLKDLALTLLTEPKSQKESACFRYAVIPLEELKYLGKLEANLELLDLMSEGESLTGLKR